jgi:hypothetical protein
MMIDMNDPDIREQVESSAYGMSVTPVALVSAMEGAMEAGEARARLEVQTASGEWADLTKYIKTGGEHAPDWGPPFPDPMKPRVTRRARALVPGPNRGARNFARKVRVAELKQRLEMTDGTGNLMVNICRLAALRSGHRRADASYQRPAAPTPKHPNGRLDTFGMAARGDWDNGGGVTIRGGTARQRACYRRAVERWMARA